MQKPRRRHAGEASECVELASYDNSEDIARVRELQANLLLRRFKFSWSTACVVAALAFEGGHRDA